MKTGQGRPQGKGLGTGLKGSAPGLLAVNSHRNKFFLLICTMIGKNLKPHMDQLSVLPPATP